METVEVFSKHSREYDSWYKTPQGLAVLEGEARLLDILLPRGVGLDLGAGTGVFAERLGEGREIVCMEPSSGMLEIARYRCLHTIQALGEYPPIRDNSMDFVYMVTVLEFLETPKYTLKVIRSLLKPNGVLAVLSIEKESPWGKLYQEIAGKKQDPVLSIAKFYTRGEVEEILKVSGYHIFSEGATLDYEPLTVPREKPKAYIEEDCPSCGVFVLVARPR